jgi:hypothetical protein
MFTESCCRTLVVDSSLAVTLGLASSEVILRAQRRCMSVIVWWRETEMNEAAKPDCRLSVQAEFETSVHRLERGVP